LVALFTSEIGPVSLMRPRFEPDARNGLLKPSELMFNVIVTIRPNQIDQVIGRLSDADMARADVALMLVMGFAG
jgi:mRNA-degrading endonuclease toxin of MazEF toxin-antitoxin module